MTGGARNTGQMTQSRASYLSREILWGYRFKEMIKYDDELECFVTDIDKLDAVEMVDTPLCSAQRIEEVLSEVNYIFEKETLANSCVFVNQLKSESDDDGDDSSDDEDRGIQMVINFKRLLRFN